MVDRPGAAIGAGPGGAIVVRGAASVCRSGGQGLEALIAQAVRAALDDTGLDLAQVDSVVALGNEQMDGGISSLLMSEAAGAYGKPYLMVTGDSGDAIEAALALLEADLARCVIVVGWCQMTKLAADDLSDISTDPLYLRPLGVGLRELADMHIGQMLFRRLVTGDEARRYAMDMRGRGRVAPELSRARVLRASVADRKAGAAAPNRRTPDRVDRATAILLSRDRHVTDRGGDGRPILRLTGFARRGGPLVPDFDECDPGLWVSEALGRLEPRSIAALGGEGVVETTAPNAYCELRGLAALGIRESWRDRPWFNRCGGGMAAHSGLSDGLARVERVFRELTAGATAPRHGLALAMGGPLGQSVSVTCLARVSP